MDSGEWRAQAEFKGNAGFHINELYSPWKRWHEITSDYLKARKHDEMLRVFQNTSLGLTYESALGEMLDWKSLYLNNRRDYISGTQLSIEDVLFVTMGCDVQKDRLELECVGWAQDKRSFSLSYDVLLGDTSQPEVWAQLTDIIQNQTWTTPNKSELKVALAAVDSGYQTQLVYNYVRKFRQNVIAIKGNPHLRTMVGYPKSVDISMRKNKVASGSRFFPVGVNIIKNELFSLLRLERPMPNEPYPPGYCSFPEHYNEEYFQGLTSEAIKEEIFRGERRLVFKKLPETRNEILDGRVYARAAASLHGLDRFSEEHWTKIKRELGLLNPVEKKEKKKKNFLKNL